MREEVDLQWGQVDILRQIRNVLWSVGSVGQLKK